ncbi:MAG TPA: ROK family protein [Actinoallomurus sp.]|nr:ROK family protein [Actinoallomurus sp.]
MSATTLTPSLEIGGTHVTAGLVELDGGRAKVLHHRREALDASGTADQIIDRIAHCAAAIRAPHGSTWGAAVPGPFDYERGIGLFRGVGKFESLYGARLEAPLRTRLPHIGPMRFLNDAEAFLVGEWSAGAVRGHGRAAGLTLGTGIGSAFLAGGVAVTTGRTVPPEGRADLLTWDDRPLEESVSRRAIITSYERATGVRTDVQEIATMARSGVRAAHDVLEHAFRTLGRALGPWWARFDASVVVVGGAMAGSWDLIKPALAAGIETEAGGALPPMVTPHHPELAPLIGAALHARRPDRPGNA